MISNTKDIPLEKLNNSANCLTYNEYGEPLKRRPVVIIKSMRILGQDYTFYIKTGTAYNYDYVPEAIEDDRARLHAARIHELIHKVNVKVTKADFINPVASQEDELIDCSKWYIMPTMHFNQMHTSKSYITEFSREAKIRIFERMYNLSLEEPPFISLNKVYVDSNQMQHELLYAHKDLLHHEAWQEVDLKMNPNKLAIAKDKTDRYSIYLKVEGLMPQALRLANEDVDDILESLTVPIFDFLRPLWNHEIARAQMDVNSDIWNKSAKDYGIEKYINNKPGKDLYGLVRDEDRRLVKEILDKLDKEDKTLSGNKDRGL